MPFLQIDVYNDNCRTRKPVASELRVRLVRRKTGLSPTVKYVYWSLEGGTSFVDHPCYSCLMSVMLSRLFIAALWSPEGKGLTSWLLCVMFIVILWISLLVSRDRCGTWLYRFPILAVFLTLCVFVCYAVSSSRCRGLVCDSWVWYFLAIITQFYSHGVCIMIFTTLINFSTNYLVMWKVYTDVGGIK